MKVGIVGCGVAMPHQMASINEYTDAQVIALCDVDELKASTAAQMYGIDHVYSNLTEMLNKNKPEVIHIMTPPATHAALTIEALNAGCHVLVEKPMALNIEDCEKMIKAAEKNNVKLCVMHNHLYDPTIVKAEQIIKDGDIGEILNMEGVFCLDKKKMCEENLDKSGHWAHHLPIGVFGEYTPHMIYVLRNFLGNINSINVTRKERTHDPATKINGIDVQVDAENAMGRLLMYDNMDYYHFTFRIYGTRAVVNINMLDLTMTIEKERNLPKTAAKMLSTVEQSFQGLANTGGNIANIMIGKLKRRPGHRMLVNKFYESIENDSQPPVTGHDGLEVVKVLELIKHDIVQ
jgi:predicted dehydrogenase